jgi:PDZ domain
LDEIFSRLAIRLLPFCAVLLDFVDSMDEKNYVAVELTKPMGIVFEENDSEYGGIFVQSLKEGGVAAANGKLQSGDQLVAVGTKNVSGMDFDDALGAILESEGETTKLNLFRGTAKQFYGPTGPSKEWLKNFCEKGGVDPQ